ncbi:MAG: hypothetical protein WCJ33_00030 [Pseudomonadota bacterium]
MQIINIKIIILVITVIIVSASIYHFSTADNAGKNEAALEHGSDHIYSDYTKVGNRKPLAMPGTR